MPLTTWWATWSDLASGETDSGYFDLHQEMLSEAAEIIETLLAGDRELIELQRIPCKT